jgi:hypothetical protein
MHAQQKQRVRSALRAAAVYEAAHLVFHARFAGGLDRGFDAKKFV